VGWADQGTDPGELDLGLDWAALEVRAAGERAVAAELAEVAAPARRGAAAARACGISECRVVAAVREQAVLAEEVGPGAAEVAVLEAAAVG
jgi:hypothetical protein